MKFLLVALLVLAAVVASYAQIASVTSITAVECSGGGAFLGGNKCYKKYAQASPVTFEQARRYCFRVGGRFPTVQAAGEQEAIVHLAGGENVWVGLRRSTPTVFLWYQLDTVVNTNPNANNINVAYSFWSPNHPDQSSNQCAISDAANNGNWTVADCAANNTHYNVNAVVCEFPVDRRGQDGSGNVAQNSIGIYSKECTAQGGYLHNAAFYCVTNHPVAPGRTFTFLQAQAFCNAYGGWVPSSHSDTDNAAFVTKAGGGEFFIGYNSILTPGTFYYDDGTLQASNYRNWASGQPVVTPALGQAAVVGSDGKWTLVGTTGYTVSTILCEYRRLNPECQLNPNTQYSAPQFVVGSSSVSRDTITLTFSSVVQFSSISLSFASAGASTGYCNYNAYSINTNYMEDYNRDLNANTCQFKMIARFDTLKALSECFIRTTDLTYDTYSTTVTINAVQEKNNVRDFANTFTTVTAARFSFRFARAASVSINNITAFGTPSPRSSVIYQSFEPSNWITTLRLLTALPWPYQLVANAITPTYYANNNNQKTICQSVHNGFCVANPRQYSWCDCFYSFYSVASAEDLGPMREVSGIAPYSTQYTCGVPGNDCGQVFEGRFVATTSQCTIDTLVYFHFRLLCSPAYVSDCVIDPNLYATSFDTTVNNFCPQIVATNAVTATMVVSNTNAFIPTYFFTLGARVYFMVATSLAIGPPIISTTLEAVSIVSGSKSVTITVVNNAGGTTSGLNLGDFHWYDNVVANGSYFVPNQASFNFMLTGETIDIIAPDAGQTVTVTATVRVTFQNLNVNPFGTDHQLLKVTLFDNTDAQEVSAVAGFAVDVSSASASSSGSAMSALMAGMIAGAGGFALIAIAAIIIAFVYVRRHVGKNSPTNSEKTLYLDNGSKAELTSNTTN